MNNEKTTQIALLIIIVLLSVNLHFQYKLMVQATKVETNTIVEKPEKEEIKWKCGSYDMSKFVDKNYGKSRRDLDVTKGYERIEQSLRWDQAIPGSLTMISEGDPSGSSAHYGEFISSPDNLVYCYAYIVNKTKPPDPTNPE